MALDTYRAKRNFTRTPEPRGARRAATGRAFVVQKHAASHLHYDFRLELDGVLLSWAVPKGPSLDPRDKRLAIAVEDHPVEYGDFEGVIPEGEYGGGTVMLWDRGTWSPIGDPKAGLAAGHLEFELHGEKLEGAWHLVRTRGSKYGGKSGDRAWLLMKEEDAFARSDGAPIVESAAASVASGRDMDDIASARERVWSAKSPGTRTKTTAPAAKETRTRDTAGKAHIEKATSPARKAGARNAIGTKPAIEATVSGSTQKATASKAPRTPTKSGPTRAARAATAPIVEVAGVTLSNPDKPYFPESGITKAEVAAYYAAVAPWMLPHLAGRPLSLVRCPDGWKGQCFYQKHADKAVNAAVDRVEVPEGAGTATYLAAGSAKALVGLVQWGVIEMHPWGSRVPRLAKPDRLVFDFDPDEGVAFSELVEGVRLLRTLLTELGLTGFLKTTGGKGLHIVVPIRATLEWEEAKAFARAVAQFMVDTFPDRFVATASKARRKGRIFLDWLRNAEGATAVAPFSVRAREHAPVAMPIAWEELRDDVRGDHFNVRTAIKRLEARREDPWADFFTVRQSITARARGRLAKA